MSIEEQNETPHRDGQPVDLQRLVRLSEAAKIRRGWRDFECDECGERWEYPTRDRFSPSGEECPKCATWIHPRGQRVDESIPCDGSGNITIAWDSKPNDKDHTSP